MDKDVEKKEPEIVEGEDWDSVKNAENWQINNYIEQEEKEDDLEHHDPGDEHR